MLPFIPYLISGAASLGSAIIQNIGAKKRQDEMNQYNTPQNQMARYGAAGLNPNLVYSQGSPGNQPSPVPYQAPSVDVAELMGKHQAFWESRSRMGLNQNRSEYIDLKTLYDTLRNEEESKYYGKHAQYSTAMMRERLANIIRAGKTARLQQANLKLDAEIKKNIQSERAYYNVLRKYGVEKGDNPLFRIGISALRHGMARPMGTSMKAGKPHPKP